MNAGYAGKTVRSLENVYHTWAPQRCVHDEALYKSTFTFTFTLPYRQTYATERITMHTAFAGIPVNTLCPKKRPPFIFPITLQKLTDFNDFWCVKSWENLTSIACTFAHLTCIFNILIILTTFETKSVPFAACRQLCFVGVYRLAAFRTLVNSLCWLPAGRHPLFPLYTASSNSATTKRLQNRKYNGIQFFIPKVITHNGLYVLGLL